MVVLAFSVPIVPYLYGAFPYLPVYHCDDGLTLGSHPYVSSWNFVIRRMVKLVWNSLHLCWTWPGSYVWLGFYALLDSCTVPGFGAGPGFGTGPGSGTGPGWPVGLCPF